MKASSHEIDILICCMKHRISPDFSNQIKQILQCHLDWPYLLKEAHRHKVVPLLYQSISAVNLGLIPDIQLFQLKDYLVANAHKNLCLAHEIMDLLDLFESSDVRALPFKGPILATSVYGSLLLRQFSDIDLLIDAKNSNDVQELMMSRGYQLMADYGWQYTFIDPQGIIKVDIHLQLAPNYFLPFSFLSFDRLYQRREIERLLDESVCSFSRVDLLIMLSVQVARGGFERKLSLSQVCDLAALVATDTSLNWKQVIAEVANHNVERPFYIGLAATWLLLNPPLPFISYQAMRSQMYLDPVIKIWAERISRQLFSLSRPKPSLSDRFYEYLMAKGSRPIIPGILYLPKQYIRFMLFHVKSRLDKLVKILYFRFAVYATSRGIHRLCLTRIDKTTLR
jgi:hypothetical protein